MAEQQAEKSGGMFSDYSFIINSPLEPSVLNFIKFKSKLKKFIQKENLDNVQLKGVSTSVANAVKDFYFIAGVDRVVLEGLSQNNPLF